MRQGIHFADIHAHERAHLRPLERRLEKHHVAFGEDAAVVVHASFRPPETGAWNVQVFHGLGDKGYTTNPIFLQRRRFPRVRTALNMVLRRLGLGAPFLRPPARPGRRSGRYEQVNAYGPRFADQLEDMLHDVDVTTFGHVALNEHAHIRPDPEGPLLWLPTWDNRRYLGGPNQSSLGPFAHEVALVNEHVPVRLKVHPLTISHGQDAEARAELARVGVDMVSSGADPYKLLDGVRGVLTDTSSIGFEAYCMGFPVAIAVPHGVRHTGLHAELAERATVLRSGKPDLLAWAEDPSNDHDRGWMEDLLSRPDRARNDAFARDLASRA